MTAAPSPDNCFAVYGAEAGNASLAGLCRDLMSHQLVTWPLLRDNCAALKDVRTRTVDCGGYEVRLQCNPKRMTSTAAPLDMTGERPCFLCTGNRPKLQKGVLYRGRYLILCNPMPIFDFHYTVVNVEHVPQSLPGALADFLRLSRDLGRDFAVFYNGPRCGASAPDHLHFQACPADLIDMNGLSWEKNAIRRSEGVTFNLTGIGRGAAVISGSQPQDLERAVNNFMAAAGSILAGDGEPMVNVISYYIDDSWRLVIYPRLKHRPEIYYGSNGKHILVSPGAVDMSGVLILPREEDFEKITEKDIRGIYEETGVDSLTVQKIIDSI